MKKTIFSTILWLAVAAQSARLSAQVSQELGLPLIQNFTPKEYNGQIQNWGVVQDSRGVMYIANGGGVLEYDGVSWRMIELPNELSALALAIDDTGRIYVGGDTRYEVC